MEDTAQVIPKTEDENARKLRMVIRTLSAISECSEDIIHGQSEQEIFQKVCDSIVRTAGYRLAWVGVALNDGEKSVKPVAQAGYEEGYLEKIHITWADTELGRGPTGTSIRERKPNICQNMLIEERFRPWRDEALKRGYASSICLPLLINGDVFSLSIYAQEPDAFNEEEVKFLSRLAENLAFGVNALRGKKELKESEEKFSVTFHASPNLIAITQLDGTIIDVNEGYSQLLGYSRDESIGKTTNELSLWVKPEDRTNFVTAVEKFGQISDFETTLRRKDGSIITVIDSARTIQLQGKLCILSIIHDITERKASYEENLAAGIYNRNLIEASLDPMLTIDEKEMITDVNHAFEDATGRVRDQLIGTDVSQYFTDPTKVKEGLRKTLQEGLIRDYRVAIKNNASGKILDCIWNTVVYKNQEGKIQGIFAAARDVSQLVITEKALQESERKYKAYIDNTFDIIYALDPSGVITYMSPRAKEYGVVPESTLGKKFDSLIAAEDREATLRAFQEGLENRLSRIRVVFRYKNSEGKMFWFEAIGTVQYDTEGNPVSNIGVMRDITERKLAEDRLRELDSVKSRFIRVVSHQLRTPLSAIRWQLESLLSEHDHLSELQKQLVQESYRANLEIISSIDDLITALDIEEGREVHLDRVPASIFSLWESIAIDFMQRCKVKNITFETHSPSEGISLMQLDTEKIRTVLQKLAENALMYSKEGGKITASLVQKDEKIHFEITDTGVGIPKDEQQYIFTRFYRASNASIMKPDASGLGLYIAKNFVESHGGKIGFTSAEGAGSTFWFELPIQ